jgi:hypothetical protein
MRNSECMIRNRVALRADVRTCTAKHIRLIRSGFARLCIAAGRCVLHVICCMLHVMHCVLLYVEWCVLHVACCPSCIIYCMLHDMHLC